VERILRATADGSDFGFSLRHALEPAGQPLKGVLFTDVLKLVKPKAGAAFALMLAEEGYTANVPLADLQRPDVLFAFEHDGAPLTADHGGPLRLIVPHLYAWKSVKWVRGFMLLDHDRLDFGSATGITSTATRGKSNAIREGDGVILPCLDVR